MYLLNLYRNGHLIDQRVLTRDECLSLIESLPSEVTYSMDKIHKGLMVNEDDILVANGGL
jgi:hypothetical protein